jgi:hypothetical protein
MKNKSSTLLELASTTMEKHYKQAKTLIYFALMEKYAIKRSKYGV